MPEMRLISLIILMAIGTGCGRRGIDVHSLSR